MSPGWIVETGIGIGGSVAVGAGAAVAVAKDGDDAHEVVVRSKVKMASSPPPIFFIWSSFLFAKGRCRK
jgi:hypothetical protein